jgi:hypothetical protein
MAVEGMPLPWRWNGSTISTDLDVIWGMSGDSLGGTIKGGHKVRALYETPLHAFADVFGLAIGDLHA